MPQNKRCYYEVLDISKTATETQIKKAYKKLAMKWHPDKNPNNRQQSQEKFREISQAYEILSKSDKRKQYDTYGHEGPKFTGSHSHFNFHDADQIFKNFFSDNPFGENDPFFGSMFGKNKNTTKKQNSFGGFGFGSSMFDNNDFFEGGFGNGGGFSSFSSSSFGGMGGGGVSKSTSTVTKTVNGKTVTVKKTTVTNPDGTKEVTEETIDGGNKTKKKYSLQPGESSKNAVGY